MLFKVSQGRAHDNHLGLDAQTHASEAADGNPMCAQPRPLGSAVRQPQALLFPPQCECQKIRAMKQMGLESDGPGSKLTFGTCRAAQ